MAPVRKSGSISATPKGQLKRASFDLSEDDDDFVEDDYYENRMAEWRNKQKKLSKNGKRKGPTKTKPRPISAPPKSSKKGDISAKKFNGTKRINSTENLSEVKKRRVLEFIKISASEGSEESDDDDDDAFVVDDSEIEEEEELTDEDEDVIELSDDEEDFTPIRKPVKPPVRRKILSDDQLEESTRQALAEEAARKKRLEVLEKSFTQDLPDLMTASQDLIGEENEISAVVFEIDGKKKMPAVQVHPDLAKQLKIHQVEANHFLWKTVCESLSALSSDEQRGSGCIIAHCMGLGKTLTTISFIHTILSNRQRTNLKTCLILAPVNAQLNWLNEFQKWVPKSAIGNGLSSVNVFSLTTLKTPSQRAFQLRKWQREGGVMVMGYQMYRKLVIDSDKPRIHAATLPKQKRFGTEPPKTPKPAPNIDARSRDSFYECLIEPGPDICVFDEGHVLKSETSTLSQVLSEITTRRRIILTGTPLQNNLREYHCMVSFVKPGILGTAKEFRNPFENPIKAGEDRDAHPYEVATMRRRIYVLNNRCRDFIHRCGFEHLRGSLPQKYEYVIMLRLTPEQTEIYQNYLRDVVGILKDDLQDCYEDEEQRKELTKRLRSRLFGDFYALRYVCSHPYLLYVARKKAEEETARLEKRENQRHSDDEFFDEEENDNEMDRDDEDRPQILRPKVRREKKPFRSQMLETPPDWYTNVIGEDAALMTGVSSKIMIALELLRGFEQKGDKCLVFSQSILMLNHFEALLAEEERYRSKSTPGQYRFKAWRRNLDFLRIDGSTSAQQRDQLIKDFNRPGNDRARLFLISTKAGGIGINLVSANRCIILDISWNPADDCQALFRAYRFGQRKEVFVYRLVAAGTMEKKIYDRQVLKQALSHRVVDKQQIARHFNDREVREMYKFDAEESGMRPDNVTQIESFKLPQDSVFADLLSSRPDVIQSYLDHDSLLVHQQSEELTEEERAAAWAEYENEKERGNRREVLMAQLAAAAQAFQPQVAAVDNMPLFPEPIAVPISFYGK